MRFTPFCLHVVRLHWEGREAAEIANLPGINRTEDQIKKILHSPEAAAILQRLTDATIDTMVQCQTVLQAAAPLILQKKIHLAMHANNESVQNKAQQELLELAGHVATRQVEIRRPDHIEEEFRDKSEAQIREEILASVRSTKSPAPREPASEKLLH